MIKRYCDRCGQQIDEGVHAWYVLELHGTDGEFRHKELCEECYESLAEDNYIPRAERNEPNSSKKPNNCTNCECTDDCSECKEVEHSCKDESQKIGYCNEFKWFRDKQVWRRCRSKNMYAPKDEPQTMPIKKTMTGTHGERIEYTEAEMVVRDEPQTEVTAQDYERWVFKDPQTERSR